MKKDEYPRVRFFNYLILYLQIETKYKSRQNINSGGFCCVYKGHDNIISKSLYADHFFQSIFEYSK